MPLLLEVNVSGEEAKHGLEPEAVGPLLEALPEHPNVEVRGLMCMASFTGGLEAARRDFAALRRLRDARDRADGTGDAAEIAAAADLLTAYGVSQAPWVMHPGAGKQENHWPAEGFADLALRAAAAGVRRPYCFRRAGKV
mgnify:CR=1 FL=1